MGCPMGYHAMPELDTTPIFDHKSVFALSFVTGLAVAACGTAFTLLPKKSTTKIRLLFSWHLFDALVHFTLGASYLYNAFYSSMSTYDVAYSRGLHSQPMTPPGISFRGDSKRLYGAFYSTSKTASLWQEYAKADKRRGGSDLTIISNELIAVFILAPMALHVCSLLYKQEHHTTRFWMGIIAICELYAGLMAFIPEWLTGWPNLDTSNFLTLWVYLVFFNGLWVIAPLLILRDVFRGPKAQ